MIIISYNSSGQIGRRPVVREGAAAPHRTVGGATFQSLELPRQLDNMLTNQPGAPSRPSQWERTSMKMRMTCLALLVAASVTPALAQEKNIELKISHWVPASHPLQKALEDWGAAVEKASDGTITYKVFPGQQLGKAYNHYDMARDAIADVPYVNPGYQPGRFPIIGAGELPFLMSDAKGGCGGVPPPA